MLGLGLNCTIGYGTLFYSFSLLSIELEQAFGWSKAFIYGVYSLGILLSGLASPFIGKALDKFNTRAPMTLGSFLITIILLCLSLIQTQWQFVLSLLLMEVVSLLVLYESAFVALSHFRGQQARLPISQITLMAGFASTIFWPLVAWLIEISDWRVTYQVMALMHLCICLPIHFFLLKPIVSPNIEQQISRKVSAQPSNGSKNYHWKIELLLAFAFGLVAFCIAGMQLHLFSIMSSLQLPETLALLAGVLIGPCQVASRLAEVFFGRLINPIMLAIVSMLAMLIGVFALYLSGVISSELVFIFAAGFGAGQGLSYIVRGAVPLYLFGEGNYGAITGRINGIRMVMTAAAPVSFAIIISLFDVITVLGLVSLLMVLSILLLFLVANMHQQQKPAPNVYRVIE